MLAPLSEVKVQCVTLSVLPIFEKATVEEILIAGRLIRGGGQKGGGMGEVRRRRRLLEATVATSEIRGN